MSIRCGLNSGSEGPMASASVDALTVLGECHFSLFLNSVAPFLTLLTLLTITPKSCIALHNVTGSLTNPSFFGRVNEALNESRQRYIVQSSRNKAIVPDNQPSGCRYEECAELPVESPMTSCACNVIIQAQTVGSLLQIWLVLHPESQR
jgi:hypothetical protein